MAQTHHYLFDTVTQYNDSVGSTHFTNNNGSIFGTGRINQCYQSTYNMMNTTSAATSANPLPSTGNFSIALWFFPYSSTGASGIFNVYNGSLLSTPLRLYGDPGTGVITFYDNVGNTHTLNSACTYNAWNHIAIVWDGANWTYYVNGVAASPTGVAPSATPAQSSSCVFQLMGENSAGGYYIDDLRIYDSNINSTEVTRIYNSGNGTQADAGVAVSLGMATNPIRGYSTKPAFPQPVINILNSGGSVETSSTDTVFASIVSGIASVGGSTSVAAVAGIATFSGLTITGFGTIGLGFTASGLSGTFSTAFNVTNANPIIPIRSETAGVVPTSGTLEIGELAFNLADQKGYIKKSDGTIVTVSQASLGSGQVISGNIASGQIGQFHFSNGAVTSGAIASGSVGSVHIADGAIRSGEIASGSIGQFHLSSGSVTSGTLGNNSVVSGSVASGQIGTFHIASGGVLSGNIASGQVGQFHLSSGSVTSGAISSGVVGVNHLASGSVTSGAIASGVIGINHLASGSVRSGAISSGVIGQFHHASGSVTSGHIGNNAVVSGSIASGTIGTFHFSSGGVLSGNIASGQIGVNHLGSGSVTSGAISSGVIGINHLASGSVRSGAIASGVIGNNHLGIEVTNINAKNNNFRVSVVSGLPVTSGDLTTQATLYLVPYNGDTISLYDGTNWKSVSASGTAVSLALGTSASGNVYDVYCFQNGAIPALELSTAWTTINARADAIQYVNGVPLKSGTLTRRFVGTVRMTGTGSTTDNAQYRYVWNWDNRVTRYMNYNDATSHNYNVTVGGTSQSWNNVLSGNTLAWLQGYAGLGANISIFTGTARTAGTGLAQITTVTNNRLSDYVNTYVGATTTTYLTGAGHMTSVNGLNYAYATETVTTSGTINGVNLRMSVAIEG